jgi:hypothetical protein
MHLANCRNPTSPTDSSDEAKVERHLITLEAHFEDTIDQLSELGELIERATEQALLLHPIDARDDDDQPGM